jgi:hypothetical protein
MIVAPLAPVEDIEVFAVDEAEDPEYDPVEVLPGDPPPRGKLLRSLPSLLSRAFY